MTKAEYDARSTTPRDARMTVKALTAALTLELLSKEGDEPPTEFRVFKKGVTETSKGLFKFTTGSVKKVVEAAKRYGNEFAVDYNHAMHSFFSIDPAESGKAAGWFRPEVREGELWATDIRWTKKAKQMLSDREYRYFSPTFRHSKDGEIEELLSVALTNTPATYGMQPLMASAFEAGFLPEQETPRMKTLLAALGLSENASEAEAMAALSKLSHPATAMAEIQALTGTTTIEGVLGTVKGWKAGMEQVTGLSKRVQELETEKKTAKQDAMLSEAMRAGKVPPAQLPFLKTLSLEQLEAYLSVAVPVVAAPSEQPKGNDQAALSVSTEEAQVAQLMGLTAEEVAAAKAARGGKVIQSTMTSKPPSA